MYILLHCVAVCSSQLSRGRLVIELPGFVVEHNHMVMCFPKYVAVVCVHLHYYTAEQRASGNRIARLARLGLRTAQKGSP